MHLPSNQYYFLYAYALYLGVAPLIKNTFGIPYPCPVDGNNDEWVTEKVHQLVIKIIYKMENLLKQLNWRYAVKKYDATKKISTENILLLQEAIKFSPSSQGLQPYRVLFIEEKTIREKLREVSYNQSQITDASHLVVFAIENNVDDKYVDRYFENICQTRNVALEGNLLHHKHSIEATINRMSVETKTSWATNQTYIALGNFLFAAAQMGIDANPMEGFMPAEYDEILGLQEKGLSAVVIACVGARHQEDFFQHFKKVRKPSSELFINI